jgi:Rrf2 family protein
LNSELAIALHILGFLASQRGRPLTSEKMASTYGTSPVVLRRVLSKLQHARLVETKRGAGGGSVLARSPDTINLRHAYEALKPKADLISRHPANNSEIIAGIVGEYVNEIYTDAEEALLETLQAITVAQMDRVVRKRIRKSIKSCPTSHPATN